MIQDRATAIRVLLRALGIVATKWTNKGYKILQEDGTHKVCVRGSIDQASMELFGEHAHDHDLPVVLLNEKALYLYNMSMVSVNDELGYSALIKVFAATLEEAFGNATHVDPYTGKIEYRRT